MLAKGRREKVLIAILGTLFPPVPVDDENPENSYLYEFNADAECEKVIEKVSRSICRDPCPDSSL